MSKKITGFFVLVNLILLVLAAYFFRQIRQRANRPNIILISVDTLRPDHMGIYGYEKNTTPNIDNFFKDGYIFTNAYTSTPKTYASIVSMMTGLSPAETKIFDYIGRPLTDKEVTLADIFSKQGYTTGAFVTNGALLYSTDPMQTNLQRSFTILNYVPQIDASTKKGSYDYSKLEELVNQGTQFIELNKNKKFFAWFHLINPHTEYEPRQITVIERRKTTKLRYKYKGSPSGCSSLIAPPTPAVRKLMDLYDQEINDTDILIELVLNKIRKLNLKQKTIVILTADHGEGFDHNYYFQHGTLYESNIKLPLLISYLGRKGETIANITPNTKFKDIILSLANKGKIPDISAKTIYGYNHFLKYFSIRENDYKLIYSPQINCLSSGEMIELYDLKKDPSELINLSAEQPELKQKLKISLVKHLKEELIK